MNYYVRISLTRYLRLGLCVCPLLLAACGADVKQSLGLGKEAPDEFVVVSRPPLTVPPDFELRPPSSDTAKSSASSTENTARKTLLGTEGLSDPASLTTLRAPSVDTAVTPVIVSPAPSGATASFLNKAGVDQANPDIRETLGADVKKPDAESSAPTLYDQVLDKEKADPVVDAQKETTRIRENEAAGKSVTEGDTPTHTPKEKSVLDRIF
ncbi:MAG: hypothetical protein B7X02_00990 [Rhodospirillales bacterium 12-54-5]|nr:MAG: hypothetical protein B7X02_00990 [Rhodospirillales bacterium 12-54-5]